MRYTMVGRSGLRVSAVGLGGNSWGAAGRRAWAPFDEAASLKLIRRAVDAGITLFDTADSYNAGDSEEILGRCLLDGSKRHDVVILTKVGNVKPGPAGQPPMSRAALIRACELSLQRLGTDYIDLYLIHRLDGITPLEETLEALTELVQQGKVRYIGGSTMPVFRMAQIATMAALGGYARPIAMQNLYNLLQREEELEMHPLCVEQGIGLTPYSPLARGVLSGNRTAEGGDATARSKSDKMAHDFELFRPSDMAVVERVKQVAAARGVKPVQVALAWLMSKPGMAAPIIGATADAHIDDAVAAVDITLTAEECRSLEEPYRWRAPA